MIAIKSISRYRAAAIHLGISAVVALATLATMLMLWYPPPLFKAMGGVELALLIVGVDVCIGPLITLVIFDSKKKELLFDLSVIATLQLAALSYGVYAMHAGRPVFTVFNGQVFAIVSAADIDPDELAKAKFESFRALSLTGPRLVAADTPEDPQERSDLTFAGMMGIGNQHLPKYYVPYAERRHDVLATARMLKDFDGVETGKEDLRAFVEANHRTAIDLRYLPVLTKRALLTAIVDAESGDLLGMIDVRPPPPK